MASMSMRAGSTSHMSLTRTLGDSLVEATSKPRNLGTICDHHGVKQLWLRFTRRRLAMDYLRTTVDQISTKHTFGSQKVYVSSFFVYAYVYHGGTTEPRHLMANHADRNVTRHNAKKKAKTSTQNGATTSTERNDDHCRIFVSLIIFVWVGRQDIGSSKQ